MTTYQIDEVAKQCGLTKRTIRYYEEIGLLFPPDRADSGFRMYSEKHIERLKQIVDAREVLGISLQEIQTFVEIREAAESSIAELRQTADSKAKYQKLLQFRTILAKQLELIDSKMHKLKNIHEDTYSYYQRVCEAIQKNEKES